MSLDAGRVADISPLSCSYAMEQTNEAGQNLLQLIQTLVKNNNPKEINDQLNELAKAGKIPQNILQQVCIICG
jgi:hypothetical protein